MPIVSRITVYPIKSLPGIDLQSVSLTQAGSLKLDREFALFDQDNQFVNAKRYSIFHHIDCHYDLEKMNITLSFKGRQKETFNLIEEMEDIENWFSSMFKIKLHLSRNQRQGFPDDTTSPGPTIISTSSYKQVQTWFPHLSLEEIRIRFRSNIELSECDAFFEDRLFLTPEQSQSFTIGEIQFEGINPCQRCIVPSRNMSGDVEKDFVKTFRDQRKANLPSWADIASFNHTYRLATNTRVINAEQGGILKLHQKLKLNS